MQNILLDIKEAGLEVGMDMGRVTNVKFLEISFFPLIAIS